MDHRWQEKHYLRAAVALLVLAGLAYAAWLYLRPTGSVAVATEARDAAPLRRAEQIDTPITSVRTFKPAVKAKLKLPPAVVANPQQQVTDATTIKPTERPVTVTSVIDTGTGETTTYSKADPYHWLALTSRGEARLSYGYKLSQGQPVPVPVGRLSITHDFIQVKAIHVGVNAAVDTDRSAFVGLGLSYRW